MSCLLGRLLVDVEINFYRRKTEAIFSVTVFFVDEHGSSLSAAAIFTLVAKKSPIKKTSDIGHRTSDIGHRTSDIGHRTSDIGHIRSDIRFRLSQDSKTSLA
jgi:hypothetical protein